MRIIILASFLSVINLTIAQNVIKLPDSYLLNRRELENGKPLEIIKMTNYHLYTLRKSEKIRKLKGEAQSNYFKKAFMEESVVLESGNYYIDNDDFIFRFSVNQLSLLDGNAFLKNKLKYTNTEIQFKNGIAIKTKSEYKGQIYSKTKTNDSLFIAEKYKNNAIISKEIINLKKGGGQSNTILRRYYKNGRLSSEQNNMEGSLISYYKNGNIERQTNKKNNSGKYFDKKGNLERQYYPKNNESCQENYANGLIQSKICRSEAEQKEYFYKNGILEYYEVSSNKTEEVKVFDPKGELIKVKEIVRIKMN